jgi:hypothetical protein
MPVYVAGAFLKVFLERIFKSNIFIYRLRFKNGSHVRVLLEPFISDCYILFTSTKLILHVT